MYQVAALLLALLFVSSGVVLSAPIRDGLLPNGNFELGPKPSQLKGSVVKERNAVPNWDITGFVEYIKSGQKQNDMVLVVPQGSSAIRLGNEASISQKISVRSGRLYSITFSAARTCAQDERLNISVTHESGIIPIQTMYGSDGWDSYSWAFKAGGPDIELRIHNPGVEEHPACGPLIDAIAIKAMFLPRYAGNNLIKNGNFENGPYVFPTAKWGVLIPPFMENDNSPLLGWIIESLKAVKYVDKAHFAVPEGHRAIELVAGKESAVSQIVRTSVNKLYALTFSVGDARDACEGPMILEAFAGRSKVMVDYASKGKGGFKRERLVFKAVSDRTRVTFLSTFYHMKSDHSGSLCGPVIDDVRLVAVRKLRGPRDRSTLLCGGESFRRILNLSPQSARSSVANSTQHLPLSTHASSISVYSTIFSRQIGSAAVDTAARKRVEDVMPIATGHEKEELEAELEALFGKNLLDINFPKGPFGTKEAPAVVKSYYDMRIVGCPGGEGEDEHDVVWFWLEKGKHFECPVCTQYFKFQVVGPGGPPDGHGDDHH